MSILWDYDERKLRKTKKGRMKIIERMINFGSGGKKINLSEVKKFWPHLNLTERGRRLFELLLWGKYQSSPKTRKKLLVK